ncbi:hypothetical protein OXPF_09880 [Oxobacter pfennigii]|uniref:DUF3189 family protein n=1 Tax=Oxobacter pfennigii TaxID=36849 RepID=A0A0P8WD13_9CLOT|nr:DUF3189 family protein [Oxobacter pfennigii]KPU45754.1 hypothetical protein OXPF_09880 [Oxobacter pfennigii]
MIVIYHDIGGTHSSVIAANMHLNRIPMDYVPDKNVLLNLPGFDRLEKYQWGHIIYRGEDEYGAKVYTLCRQYKPEIVVPAVTDMYLLLKGTVKGLYMVNTTPTVNWIMGIGGYSSRVLGFVPFGRPIVTYGALIAYPKISKVVKELKNKMRSELDTAMP